MQNADQWVKLKEPSLTNRTVAFLTDLLIQGQLHPGDFLPTEQELTEKLGVGRSTVREAIRVLEARGMVNRKQGVGVMVVDHSQQAAAAMFELLLCRNGASVAELFEVRRMYEVQAVVLAAQRLCEEDLSELRQTYYTMQASADDIERFALIDMQFHLGIVKAAKNRVLLQFVETIRPLLQKGILATLDPRPDERRRCHDALMDALTARDPPKAELAMKEHLSGLVEKLAGVELNWNQPAWVQSIG